MSEELKPCREWTVGQSVIAVCGHNRRSETITEHTVKRIGRKWAYYEQYGRDVGFDKLTGAIDGGQYTSPGTVWASLAEYETDKATNAAYNDLRSRMAYTRMDGVDLDAIRQAAALLRLTPIEGTTP